MDLPRQSSVFGKRKEPHTVIIARGNSVRHFTIRPWMLALAGSFAAAAFVGYLGATTYLVMRDDLIGATVTRQARMQQAYEDRISALRAQIDRVTSRQLLDQQLMEDKVAELMDRQSMLAQRNGRLEPIINRALGGPDEGSGVPVPTQRPNLRAEISDLPDSPALGYAGSVDPVTTGSAFDALLKKNASGKESVADRADRTFVEINRRLRAIETEQVSKLQTLTASTWTKTDRIVQAAADAGIRLPAKALPDAQGGPYIPPTYDGTASSFETYVDDLDDALNALTTVKTAVSRVPIANPAPGRERTSSFGIRRDPFTGRRAMHSGVDFRTPVGASVMATAKGTVIHAGWNGGYGRMVEVDHGNGLTTRYAHMSAISVKEGQKVDVGTIVGKAGSSGRSTGPHLHYEVRIGGKAVDPMAYLRAGRKVLQLL